MKKIYLDYASTAPIDPEVKAAMAPYFSEKFGNPGSLHSFGQEAMTAVDLSRETVAKIIGADFREIVFTGSATEANNFALRGIVKAARFFPSETGRSLAPAASAALGLSPRRLAASRQDRARRGSETFLQKKTALLRIIVSSIEHESVLETAKDLAENEGVEVIYLPVNKNGMVDLKKLKESLNERTILVSVMHANNEIGTIQPIAEISNIVRNFREELRIKNDEPTKKSKFIIHNSPFPLFHTDAVQAFQFLDCDVEKLGVDFMTLSAHKIYGPKGIGILYVRKQNFLNTKSYFLDSIITGGGQEFNLRSGTENVPAIVGFAEAVELADKLREKESKRIGDLRNYFWQEIKKIYPKVQLNPTNNLQPIICIPNILNIYFPNRRAEDLIIKMDMVGLAVSAGSACAARATEFSHVLTALGLSKERIRGSVRFSFGRFTTKSEVKEALRRLKNLNLA